MARYFSRTRKDGKPADVRERRNINGDPLPDDAAYAHPTPEGLMQDDALMSILANPDVASEIDDWMVVEYEADPATVVTPNADEQLDGVFAIPLAEIQRTPLLGFIDHYVANGTPDQKDAAEMLQTMAEVALEP